MPDTRYTLIYVITPELCHHVFHGDPVIGDKSRIYAMNL